MQLTLMTYNIRLGIQEGLSAIAEVIRAHRPDLVALQEVGLHWTMGPPGDSTAELAELTELAHSHHVACIHQGDAARYGHALLSRWPIESPDEIELPEVIDEPRRILVSRIAHPEQAFDLVSTHLSYKIDDRRHHGPIWRDTLRLRQDDGGLTFAMGDLNHSPEEDEGEWLHEILASWQDADAAKARRTYPSSEPRLRLDYILASHGTFAQAEVLDHAEASDHLAVVARWHDA